MRDENGERTRLARTTDAANALKTFLASADPVEQRIGLVTLGALDDFDFPDVLQPAIAYDRAGRLHVAFAATNPDIPGNALRHTAGAPDAPPVACDVDTDGPVTPATCYVGQRDCAEGRWGACRAYRPRFQ